VPWVHVIIFTATNCLKLNTICYGTRQLLAILQLEICKKLTNSLVCGLFWALQQPDARRGEGVPSTLLF
jgi:hypothetical protein